MRAPDFWAPGKGGVVATLLSPIGAIVGAITAAHVRKAPTWTASVPVICVGNAVMGGAGKTQISRDIADRLKARGQTPHIIMRGYGGRLAGPVQVDPQQHTATDVGDEAILLARRCPHVDRTPAARSRTRRRGGGRRRHHHGRRVSKPISGKDHQPAGD